MAMVAVPTTTPAYKTCVRCTVRKPIDEFHFRYGSNEKPGVRRGRCKECDRANTRALDAMRRRAERVPGAKEKFCPACQEVKPIESFRRRADASDRRSTRCRKCLCAAEATRQAERGDRSKGEWTGPDVVARLEKIRQEMGLIFTHATETAAPGPTRWSELSPREASDRVRRLFGTDRSLELFYETLVDVAESDDED